MSVDGAKRLQLHRVLGFPCTGVMALFAKKKPKHLAGSGLRQAKRAIAIQAFWQEMIPPLRPHDDRCMLALARGNQVGGDE